MHKLPYKYNTHNHRHHIYTMLQIYYFNYFSDLDINKRIHNTAKQLCVKSILTLYSSEKLLYETILVRTGLGVFVPWSVGICIALYVEIHF